MKNNIYTAIPDWFNKVQSQSTDNTSTTTTQTTIIGGGGSISMSVHNLFIKSDTTITIDNFTISDLFVTDQITDTENWLTTPLLHTLPNTEVSVTTAAQQLYIGAYDKNNNQIKLYQFSEAISTVVIPENCYYLRASSNKTNTDLTIKYVGLNNFDETQQNKLESSSFQNFLTLVEGDEKGVITNSVQNLSLVFQNPLYYTLDKAGNVLISIDRDALFSQSENPTDDRYVTTVANSVQDILSSKNFKEGLSINGIEIVERNGFLYIKGNLATTGGITAYTDDPDDPGGSGGLPGGGAIGDIVITGSGNALVDASLSKDHSVITFTKGWLVDAESDQSITGIKDFINGLKLDGQLIKIVDGVLFLDCSIAATGGITAYATENVDVSTIMDGVAVDEITITKGSDNILRIKNAGAGSSFDENAMWSALASSSDKQIDKSHITTALEGYATEHWVISNYATLSALESVSTKLNNFLEGSDTDNIINKWKELEAFLSGMTETDNLAEILETKADKSYVDSTFVTIATKQTITGEKTFSSVLNTAAIKASGAITAPSLAVSDWVTIAGIKLRKLEDGALMLEGNLALTGALTMYASNGQSFDTIYDGLPIDNDTIYWQEVNGSRVLKAREGSGSSFDKSAMWTALAGSTTEQINKSHLTTALDGYATESWVTNKGYITNSALNGYATEEWVTGKNYAVKATTLAGYGITDAPTKTGSGASGTWGIGITGNAATASKWATARTITLGSYLSGSVSLDGSVNVTLNANVLGLTSQGNKTAATGNTSPASGVRLYQVYDNGYPTTYGNLLSVKGGGAGELLLSWNNANRIYYRSLRDNGDNWLGWNELAFITDNVASATKLKTARTLWGRSFDGTGNVSGNLDNVGNINTIGGTIDAKVFAYNPSDNHDGLPWYGMAYYGNNVIAISGYGGIELFTSAGNVLAIGTDNKVYANSYVASNSFRSTGDTGWYNEKWGGGWYMSDSNFLRSTNEKSVYIGNGSYRTAGGGYAANNTNNASEVFSCRFVSESIAGIPAGNIRNILGWYDSAASGWQTSYIIGSKREAGNNWGELMLGVYQYENAKRSVAVYMGLDGAGGRVYIGGNLLVTGGVTLYGSDIRYKSIIQSVPLLSLNKIAKAPSFVYHWNKEGMKCDRLNLGGSAQYTQSILPWAVEDKDNFLSMDYATVAYTFAVHTARHLLDYETKTDKEIRKLKNRIKYLEKQLKSLHYEEANIVDN